LRLFSLKDVGAMKIAAITGRGRKRDFTDLYFLMKQFTLPELIGFYNEKYPDGNEFMAIRSLSYFGDAEEDEDMSLFKKADWSTVKKTLEKAVRSYYK
jgi:Nucleotidyl transferase AbiEii toxin, Type IV TA system